MDRIDLDLAGVESTARTAAEVLIAGGVIAAPTETVYGLMTLWNCAAGRERIYRMKNRPADQRLQMLAGSIADAMHVGLADSVRLQALSRCFWPGPLTVVCPAAGGDTIGLRLPDHLFLACLLRQLGVPLAATSANRSGLPPALRAEAAIADLAELPDLLIDGGCVGAGKAVASTVVDISNGEFRVLRGGPISTADLMAALGSE